MGRAIAVDWSGAESPSVQRSKIWVACACDGSLVSLSCGRTRSETIDLLLDELSAAPSTVVGMDFAFSFPAWWVASHDVPAWDLAASLGESWLASCSFPFWGRPGRPCRVPAEMAYRRTEARLQPRPGSIFQIGGAGSVGTASVRGMSHLRRLAAEGVAIWPFDDWPSPAASGPVVAEVWPRMAIGSVVKSSPAARAAHLPSTDGVFAPAVASDDAFDAACAAIALSASPGLRPPVELDSIDRVEGRILDLELASGPVDPRGRAGL